MFSPTVAHSVSEGDPSADPATTSESTDKSTATFDLRTGELRITCLEVNGIKEKGKLILDAKYDVVMKQRGNSSNWEITFVNPGCAENELPPEDAPPADDSAS